MRIAQTVMGLSFFVLGASVASAADGKADATPGPTAATTEPAAAKTEATAGQSGATAAKDAIVGSWRCAVDGEVMEFAADGKARIKDTNAIFMATYELTDDGSLHLEVPAFVNQKDFVYKFELQGDVLTLTRKDQKPRKYDRVK